MPGPGVLARGRRGPAPFRKNLGIRVEEFRPLAENEKLTCVSDGLGRLQASRSIERLRAGGAEALATIAEGVRAPVPERPAGVEAARRGEVLFPLDHGGAPAVVALDRPHGDVATGAAHDGSVALDRFGAAALCPAGGRP